MNRLKALLFPMVLLLACITISTTPATSQQDPTTIATADTHDQLRPATFIGTEGDGLTIDPAPASTTPIYLAAVRTRSASRSDLHTVEAYILRTGTSSVSTMAVYVGSGPTIHFTDRSSANNLREEEAYLSGVTPPTGLIHLLPVGEQALLVRLVGHDGRLLTPTPAALRNTPLDLTAVHRHLASRDNACIARDTHVAAFRGSPAEQQHLVSILTRRQQFVQLNGSMCATRTDERRGRGGPGAAGVRGRR